MLRRVLVASGTRGAYSAMEQETESLRMSRQPVQLSVSLAALLCCAAGFCSAAECSEAWSEKITPLLPEGWKMTVEVKEGRVILERKEKIGLYNGLGLPRFKSDEERRAYVKPHVVYETLVITLRLGDRIDAEQFSRISKSNSEAVERARKDQQDLKFMPDEKFWKDHPNYGYKELPILDTGTQSIFMECPSHAISRPIKDASLRGSGRIRAYFNPDVEKECQGFIDAIGERFTPYSVSGD